MSRESSRRPEAGRRRSPRPAALAVLAAGAWLVAGCGGEPAAEDGRDASGDAAVGEADPSAAASATDVSELDPPTAPGSGQPRISADPAGGFVLSWLRPAAADGEHELVFARRAEGRWSEPRMVARGDDFFVNWADLPSVVPLGGDSLVAHWLQETGPGPYAYGVRMAFSADGGETWGETIVPHRDGTPTEHGFVSLLPAEGGGVRAVWLDGRRLAEDGGASESAGEPETSEEAGEGGAPGGAGEPGASGGAGEPGASGEAGEPAMTLRSAVVLPDGELRSPSLLDGRVCDCCQTSAARTARGPLVVYRDRDAAEVRDISAVRRETEGWTRPAAVHRDGWRIEACPVNGPAVAARGDTAAAAWFTGADGRGRVRVAFSTDAGTSFGAPVRVDGGDPVGRVDVVLTGGARALVSWVESTEGGAEIRLREVRRDGTAGPPVALASASAARAGGFPRAALSDGRLAVAWTDPAGEGRVRVAEVSLPTR